MRHTARPLTATALALTLAAFAAAPAYAAAGTGRLELSPTGVVPGDEVTVRTAACGTGGTATGDASAVDVKIAVRIGLAALAGSTAGAFVAAGMSTEILKPVVMVVLVAVGAFVILRPAFGTAPGTGPVSARRVLAAIGLAGVGIGFYDGLVGPGTGTFLVLALTAVLHLDLVTASATAKIVNCCTNAGALATFAWKGTVYWQLAALMAVFNLVGGTVGARTALKKGSGFVRVVLLTVVFTLVAKMGYEQWVA
ncbi:sulfite exporter TauE/SafE family protein [Streptomyces griseiscabiei]|uniref:sulfite exporter TauE/SafE family protein n=1 Tax=Streptomyces griseiscabiei TaxID=2993540 RepID=UPI000A37B6BE|nr:TSUP family transporter [Streptomyces griseiscabiei]